MSTPVATINRESIDLFKKGLEDANLSVECLSNGEVDFDTKKCMLEWLISSNPSNIIGFFCCFEQEETLLFSQFFKASKKWSSSFEELTQLVEEIFQSVGGEVIVSLSHVKRKNKRHTNK